jgi:hypothetical protein
MYPICHDARRDGRFSAFLHGIWIGAAAALISRLAAVMLIASRKGRR